MKIKVTSIITLLYTLMGPALSYGQCAMCRATVENNVSHGDYGIASGLNFGILYLFVIPYLAVAVIAFLWYKNSKEQQKKLRQLEKLGLR